MKITNLKVGLISFHSFLKPGGVKKHIFGLDKEFRKRGIKTKIIVPRRSWKENYGKDVILLGTSIPLYLAGNQVDLDINFNPISIWKTLRKEKFEVLHFHNFVLPSAFQILVSPATKDTLNILTIHANLEKMLNQMALRLYFSLCKEVIQWRIDGVIGVAPLTLTGLENLKKPKIVIPNGIDLNEFNPRIPKIKKFCDGKINILFVGRIEERKGLIYLLKAFKILAKNFSNLRLIIVGDGPLKAECQEYAKENHLREVYFEGEKTGKEVASYYSTSDIFVAPSIFGESFGIVLIEAMASGKPIVAFANQGYKEVLEKVKGKEFLVKPRDFKTLAQKLAILIKNQKLREEMGRWGQKEARKYSWPKIAKKVLDFYQLCKQYKKRRDKEKNFSLGKILRKISLFFANDVLR